MIQTDEECLCEIFEEYGKGLYLKYIYMIPNLTGNDDNYTSFMAENKNYYMYDEEVELINEEKDRIADLVGSNTNIIDFGPGLSLAIESKTLKAMSRMTFIKSYTAIDIEQSYALNATSLIHKRYPTILTSAIYADIMNDENVECLTYLRAMKNKTILSFNCMIHNLTMPLIDKLLNNLSKLLNTSDMLVLGLDTNQDPVSLLKSYEKGIECTLDIFRYFKIKFQLAHFDPEAFKVMFDINKVENNMTCVKCYTVATRDQSFEFKDQTFEIKEGDVYFMWFSMRFSEDFVKNAGAMHSLDLREVIQNKKNKMKLFVLVKI